jgi:phosphoribosyl 1,2-cyclic phosphate phosphodiesterase
LSEKFRYVFDETMRPLPGTAKPEGRPLILTPDVPVTVGDLTVHPFTVPHGRVDVLAFRIGPLGYVTDAKTIPANGIDILRGVKVLVLNALFRAPHPTHLSISEAVAVAREVGAERTFLTHLTHENFHADLEAELPGGIAPAFDGLTVHVG